MKGRKKKKNRRYPTWELPRLHLVDVHACNEIEADGLPTDFALEVIDHQLLIRWVKPEPWSQYSD